MKFATRPDGQDEPIVKDRANVVFGPVNADVTIDIPELQIATEQARQEAAGTQTAAVTETVTTPNFLLSGYWVNPSSYSNVTATNTTLNDTGYAIPFYISENASLSGIGIVILDGVSATVYNALIGLYSDLNGFPGELLGNTPIFDYGDGTVPNNTVRYEAFNATITVAPGKYWLVFRQTAGALGAVATARFRWRETYPGNTIVLLASIDGTSPGARSTAGSSWSINFSLAPSATTLPDSFATTDFLYLVNVAPEIYLGTA